MVRSGEARPGKAWQAGRVLAWPGLAVYGEVWQAWRGVVLCGMARLGMAGMDRSMICNR